MTNGHNSQHKQPVRLAGSSQRWLELERLAGGTVGGPLAALATSPASSPAGTVHPLLESTTFPGAKDTRERAGNTGKFLSLVPTLGISHSGEKSRENIGFPECFQKTHGNYYNFPCVMIPECFKGTHRNYYSLPCVLISECFKGTHGNLL